MDFPALSWWHLSDIHVPKENQDRVTAKDHQEDELKDVFEDFVSVMENLKKHESQRLKWQPNFVFFTGDISLWGNADQYKRATDLFNRLLTVFSLKKERLFVVPGNHDFNRSKNVNTMDLTSENATHKLGINPDYFVPLNDYNDWCEKYFGNRNQILTKDHQYYVEFRDVSESSLRVGVVGLNTIINSFERINGESAQGRVVIGEEVVKEISEILEKDPPDLTFVLGHFPLNWISEKEAAIHIGTRLRENSDFYLCGHIHEYGVLRTLRENNRSYGLHPFFEVTSGALNQKGVKWYPNTAIFASLSAKNCDNVKNSILNELNNPVKVEFKTFSYCTTENERGFVEDTGSKSILGTFEDSYILRNNRWYSYREKKLITDLENSGEKCQIVNGKKLPFAILIGEQEVYGENSVFKESPFHGNMIEAELVDDLWKEPDLRMEKEIRSIEKFDREYNSNFIQFLNNVGGNNRYNRIVAYPKVIQYNERKKMVIELAKNPQGLGFWDSLYRANDDFKTHVENEHDEIDRLEKRFSLANVTVRMALIHKQKDGKHILFRLTKDNEENRIYKKAWDAGIAGHIHCDYFDRLDKHVLYKTVTEKVPDPFSKWLPTYQECNYFNIIREFPLGEITIIGCLNIDFPANQFQRLPEINRGFEIWPKISKYEDCLLEPTQIGNFMNETDNRKYKWTPGAVFSCIQALRYEGHYSSKAINTEFLDRINSDIWFVPFKSNTSV